MKQMYGQRAYVQSAGVRNDMEIDGFSVAVCKEMGIELSRHRSRSFEEMEQWGDDLSQFDLIVALSPASQRQALELTRYNHLEVEYWPILDPTGLGESREAKLAPIVRPATRSAPGCSNASGRPPNRPRQGKDRMTDATHDLIARYYAAFNAADAPGMLACVSEDVEHRVNEGGIRRGKALFAEFCAHMGVSYREELRDIVIFTAQGGSRAAAEFTVHGTYLTTDRACPKRAARSIPCRPVLSST